jgi:hypothetical protein
MCGKIEGKVVYIIKKGIKQVMWSKIVGGFVETRCFKPGRGIG